MTTAEIKDKVYDLQNRVDDVERGLLESEARNGDRTSAYVRFVYDSITRIMQRIFIYLTHAVTNMFSGYTSEFVRKSGTLYLYSSISQTLYARKKYASLYTSYGNFYVLYIIISILLPTLLHRTILLCIRKMQKLELFPFNFLRLLIFAWQLGLTQPQQRRQCTVNVNIDRKIFLLYK